MRGFSAAFLKPGWELGGGSGVEWGLGVDREKWGGEAKHKGVRQASPKLPIFPGPPWTWREPPLQAGTPAIFPECCAHLGPPGATCSSSKAQLHSETPSKGRPSCQQLREPLFCRPVGGCVSVWPHFLRTRPKTCRWGAGSPRVFKTPRGSSRGVIRAAACSLRLKRNLRFFKRKKQ